MSKETKAWFTVDELNAWAEKKLKENPQWADQPAQQEPVAWLYSQGKSIAVSMNRVPGVRATPLYTNSQPAQRTWVGLTDDELDDLLDTYITAEGRARAIEAKLKELNT